MTGDVVEHGDEFPFSARCRSLAARLLHRMGSIEDYRSSGAAHEDRQCALPRFAEEGWRRLPIDRSDRQKFARAQARAADQGSIHVARAHELPRVGGVYGSTIENPHPLVF